jgi:putative phosphoesterase
MRIGVISDTHDNIGKIKSAVEFLKSEKIEYLIHCGDFVAPFVLPYLEEGNFKKIIGVFGNNDGEKLILKKKMPDIYKPPFSFTLENFKILILHEPLEEEILKCISYDLIAYGHTHIPKILKNNECLIVNPGECCGWLTGKSTISLVDLKEKKAEIFQI